MAPLVSGFAEQRCSIEAQRRLGVCSVDGLAKKPCKIHGGASLMDFEDVLKTFLKILDVSGTEMELRAWDVERHPYIVKETLNGCSSRHSPK